MNSLIEHTLNKTGYVEVMDVTFYDTVTNEPVLLLDTLKISNISGEASSKQIIGGIKAPVIAEYAYKRAINLEFQDAVCSLYSLQRIWGGLLNEATQENGIKGHARFIATTDGSSKIAKTDPALVSGIHGGEITKAVGYDDTGKKYEAEVASNDLTFSECVTKKLTIFCEVDYKAGEQKYSPVEIVLRSDKFPDAVRAVGNTIVLDVATGKQVYAELEIPKLSIVPANNLSLEAEGDAAVFDFSGSALAVDGEQLKLKHLAWY